MTEWNKYNQPKPSNPPDPVGNKEEPEDDSPTDPEVDEETDQLDDDAKTIVEKLEEIRSVVVLENESMDRISDQLNDVLDSLSDMMEEMKAFRVQLVDIAKTKVVDSQWEDVEEDFKPRKPVSGLGEPSKKPKPKKKGRR